MHDSAQIIIAETSRAAAEAAAQEFVDAAQSARDNNRRPSLAISGGSTPRELHRLLTRPPYRSAIAWDRVDLFWVDERIVPYRDAASNFGAARQDLIVPLGLDQDQIHPMPVVGTPAALAAEYEASLKKYFGPSESGPPRFVLICLGLGTDGHTASLFPEDSALSEKRRWVVAVEGGQPHVSRLTLTLPVINSGKKIIMLATGSAKAAVVREAIEQAQGRLPVHLIRPISGSMIWILDRSAANSLSDSVN